MGAVSEQRRDEGDQRRSSEEREGRHKELGAVQSCLPAADKCSAGLGCVSRQGWGDQHRGFVCSGKLSAWSGTEQSHLSQGLSPSPQCRQVSSSICVHFNG